MVRQYSNHAVILSIILLAVVALGSGCRNTETQESNPRTRAVRVIQANHAAEGRSSIQVSGVVRAKGQVQIGFQVAGQVAAVLVEEGDQVRKGHALARLNDVPYAAQRDQAAGTLNQAQAMLSLSQQGPRQQDISMAEAQLRSALAVQTHAKSEVSRMEQLYAEGVIALQQLEAVETELKQATEALAVIENQLDALEEGARPQEIESAEGAVMQAAGALKSAQQQLEYTALRAPSDGVIVWKSIERGMTAVPGVPVFEIADLTELEIAAEIPQSELTNLAVGNAARVEFPALDDFVCAAVITHIAPKAQSGTRGFPVRLSIASPEAGIVPGLVALVEFKNKAMPDGLRIPSRAIVNGNVFIVNGSIARAQPVEVLAESGEYAFVNGISADEQIVINGQHFLTDGEMVNIVNALAIEDITKLSAR